MQSIIGEADFIESGVGPKVILIHSSVAGARQWAGLMDELASKFHVIAINLFGYGKTSAWAAERTQTLEDQARLIEALLPDDGSKISIVGHSFGGSVAMKAAALFKEKVHRLILIEPNPFYLLDQNGRSEAYQEALSLRDCIKDNGRQNTWELAAMEFADYWTGEGSWNAMKEDRKAKFIHALKPNFQEWDAVMNERTSLSEWEASLPKDTTVLAANDTVRSIAEIVDLMRKNISSWRFEQIEHGGHMAAMTRPELINPIVKNALI